MTIILEEARIALQAHESCPAKLRDRFKSDYVADVSGPDDYKYAKYP